MTPKEMWIFKGILGIGGLMILAIIGLVIFGFVIQKEAVDMPQAVRIQPTETPIPETSIQEEDILLSAFMQKVAPVEVGPAHRAVEQQLIGAFVEGQILSAETFEGFLRPLLTVYFNQWVETMAVSVFTERQMEIDEDLVSMMLSSVDVEDKVHFMLLYEKVFLKSRGIVIEEQK